MNDEPADMAQSGPPAVLVYLLGVLGGLAGIVAACFEEMRQGIGGLLLVTVVGPAVEEVCKPLGVIFLLDKRPGWLKSPARIVMMVVLGAATFAVLENLLYIHFYHPLATAGFIVWRHAVCTSVHVGASTIFSLGLVRMWKHIRRHGGHFDIDVCFPYYVAAVAVHAAYNVAMVILQRTGVVSF